MDTYDNRYSNFVSWTKILLPLAGIVLLSTLFLFARPQGGDGTIPFAELEEIAREPRIAAPNFSGVTSDGSIFAISAATARPLEGQAGLTIETLTASIDAADGTRIDISAGTGMVNTSEQTATMGGLARLTSSSGYVMETTGLMADLETGRVESTGPLEARAPYGALTAGHLVIETPEGGAGQQMVFNDGVRLIYTPQE